MTANSSDGIAFDIPPEEISPLPYPGRQKTENLEIVHYRPPPKLYEGQGQHLSLKVVIHGPEIVQLSQSEVIEFFTRFGPVETDHTFCNAWARNTRKSDYVTFRDHIGLRRFLSKGTRWNPAASRLETAIFYRRGNGLLMTAVLEVIPWALESASLTRSQALPTHMKSYSVFVANFSCRMTAEDLCNILDSCFGKVHFVSIVPDRYKYTTGIALAAFSDHSAYLKATHAAKFYVDMGDELRILYVVPGVGAKHCSVCRLEGVRNLCADITCLKTFCDNCWRLHVRSPTTPHENGRAFDISPFKF